MPFCYADSLKLHKFSSLEDHGLYHAVFTRQGGFSPPPWDSLNFGASVGDENIRVMKNRELALNTLHHQRNSVFDVYQVHSSRVVITDRSLHPYEIHEKADAILTNKPNISLMMRFADCVPILIFDRDKRAIGLVHAGWLGTVEQIVKKAINEMIKNYGSKTSDIIAAIGPSIGPDHYEVGENVIARVESSFGALSNNFIIDNCGKTHFDLWKANEYILRDLGVQSIELSEICTVCHLEDWYSHRGEHGKTGRFGVIFGLLH